jgi:CubicO group peptidase (beta-lactamase class C family)
MCIHFKTLGWMATALVSAWIAMPWASAQSLPQPSDEEVRARVDTYMKAAVEFEKFSGSILIARDGHPIVSRGYGWANAELEVPNAPNTVFRLASLTKQFTAAAILLLQERGKLKTTDRLCVHLPDCPESWQSITLRQLLSMTAGVPGIAAAELGPLRGLPVPWDQWMEATRKKPLEFTPGSDFKYSNAGYTLLGFVIERISKMSYGDFLATNIFAPLGMTQTAYEEPTRIVMHRATGYKQLPGEPLANVPYAELIRLYAAGGVYSTTEDLLRWDRALQASSILSQQSMQEMVTPIRDMYPGKRYAYGLWTSEKFGRQEVAHGGNLAGFITYFARFPADRASVIVLSNNGRGSSGKISHQLSAILFGAPHETPQERRAIALPAELLKPFVGEYVAQFPPTDYSITLEAGKLMVLESGFAKSEMHAETPSDFFLKTADIQFKFVRNANGEVTGFVAHQGDSTLYETVEARRKAR